VGNGLREIVALSATVCAVRATTLFSWRWILRTGLQEIVALGATPVCKVCDSMICPGWTFSAGLQKIVALSATVCMVCATTLFSWRWIPSTALREIVALSATPVCSMCNHVICPGWTFGAGLQKIVALSATHVRYVQPRVLSKMVIQYRSAGNRGTQCYDMYRMCTTIILLNMASGYLFAGNCGTECHAHAQHVRQLDFVVDARRRAPTGNRGTQHHGMHIKYGNFVLWMADIGLWVTPHCGTYACSQNDVFIPSELDAKYCTKNTVALTATPVYSTSVDSIFSTVQMGCGGAFTYRGPHSMQVCTKCNILSYTSNLHVPHSMLS
jgi:hypothetical protein